MEGICLYRAEILVEKAGGKKITEEGPWKMKAGEKEFPSFLGNLCPLNQFFFSLNQPVAFSGLQLRTLLRLTSMLSHSDLSKLVSKAGRDWGQEEKGTTEDEMAGWHH